MTIVNPSIFGPSDVFKAGRDMPAGSIRWHMDCSADPLNILAPAQMIVSAIKTRMAELPPDQKLAVLMGETHSMPTHKLLQQMVMQLLRVDPDPEVKKFTMNFELDHNLWPDIAVMDFGFDLPKGLRYLSSYYDPYGIAALSALNAFFVAQFAPVSTQQIFAWSERNKIDIQFNDAASTYSGHLDLRDPVTAETSQQCGADVTQNIDFSKPTGTKIRNTVMAKLATNFAHRHNHRLILQSSGKDHVLGTVLRGEEFKNSLTSVFKASGIEVLPVFCTSISHNYGLNALPEEAIEILPESIVIDGLNQQEFLRGIETKKSERLYIKAMRTASGRQLEIIPEEDREILQLRAFAEARALITRYEADPARARPVPVV